MKLTITRWENLINPHGSEHELTWAELVELLTSPQTPFQGNNVHPGWSPASFRGQQRALAAVRNVFALCLDYDAGETIDATAGLLEAFTGVIQTTRKHTPENPRFRVVLPLARSVSRFEFAGLWVRFNHFVGRKVDPAPKDSSRFWYLPATSEHFESRILPGGLLDPDEWLDKPDPTPVSVPVLPRVKQPKQQTQDQAHIEKRASAYLATIDGAIEGNGGDKQTFRAAVAMARGFALSQQDAFRLLWNEYNPRCVPPWNQKGIERKVEYALKAEKVPLGCLLNNPSYDFNADLDRAEPEPHAETEPDFDYDRETGEVFEREPGDDTEEIAKEQAQTTPVDPVARFGVITLHTMYQTVIEEAKRGANQKGFMTGITEIDNAIGGLRCGNVCLLAAQTSWGKSSFGIMTMVNNLGGPGRPLIVSVEDKLLLYAKRVTASTCKINALALRDNELAKRDFERIYKSMTELPNEPVFIDAVGKSVEWVAEAITACCKHLGTKLVIADYVQRFKTNKHSSDKKNQVTYIGETLSDAIKNGGAAGLVLSQVKRTQGKEPTMDDVKESGDLENMAEHVIIGWKEEDKSGGTFQECPPFRKYNIPKNKDGPIVMTWRELSFDGVTASFMPDVDYRMQERDRAGLAAFDDIADN